VEAGVNRILGSPNDMRENLVSVKLLLPEDKRKKADELIANVTEYVKSINFDTYFDRRSGMQLVGSEAAQYIKFSEGARAAAARDLAAFFALCPIEEVDEAKIQLREEFGAMESMVDEGIREM
jgi:hypothetical protein